MQDTAECTADNGLIFLTDSLSIALCVMSQKQKA